MIQENASDDGFSADSRCKAKYYSAELEFLYGCAKPDGHQDGHVPPVTRARLEEFSLPELREVSILYPVSTMGMTREDLIDAILDCQKGFPHAHEEMT